MTEECLKVRKVGGSVLDCSKIISRLKVRDEDLLLCERKRLIGDKDVVCEQQI